MKSKFLGLVIFVFACSSNQGESEKMKSLSSFYKDRSDLDYRTWMPKGKTGQVQELYENGNLKLSGNFRNGKPIDSLIQYWPNGQIKDLVFFKNGLPEGIQKGYHSDGSLKYYANYDFGLPNYHKQYNEKGQLIDFSMAVAMKSPTVSKNTFNVTDTVNFHLGLAHSMFSNPIFLHYFIVNSDTLDSRTTLNMTEKFVLDSLIEGTYQLDFHILEYDGRDSTFQGGTVYTDSIRVIN